MTITSNNKTTGRIERRIERRIVCHSCELVRINGLVCHETGCPDAWRDSNRECKECGTKFVPEERHQKFCEPECAMHYYL